MNTVIAISGHWADVLLVALAAVGFRLYMVGAWARGRRAGSARPFLDATVRLVNQITAVLAVTAVVLLFVHLMLPARWAAAATSDVFLLLAVVLLAYAWRSVEIVLRRQADRDQGWANVLAPALVLSKAAVIVVGGLILIKGLFPGLRLTLIWTTFGVGGLAAALALNDTLSNLFAGLYVLLDQPVRAGDLITLNTGETGYVQHIGLRSTRLRQLNSTVAVIPNSVLAKATIINHNLPDPTAQMTLEVAVGYEHPPERIEALLLEETNAARADCPRILREPAPSVTFSPGFQPTSMHFTIIAYTSDYSGTFAAAAAIRRRLYHRLKAEGIPFPPPTNTFARR